MLASVIYLTDPLVEVSYDDIVDLNGGIKAMNDVTDDIKDKTDDAKDWVGDKVDDAKDWTEEKKDDMNEESARREGKAEGWAKAKEEELEDETDDTL